MQLDFDLVDVWENRNPTASRFTWRQKTPLAQRRLDYWLISDSLQDEITSAEIKTSIKTYHLAITLSIRGLNETERGPNFLKFNSNLVNEADYCDLFTTECANWLEEFKEVQGKRVLWDLIIYKIRQRTITYSKGKARERAKLQKYVILIQIVEISRNWSVFKQNMINETITLHKGQLFALGQPGMKWVRKKKFFLNLENSNKTKSSVRKILTTDGALTSDPKKIMNELELYYSNLYDGRNSADTQTISSFINNLTDVPY